MVLVHISSLSLCTLFTLSAAIQFTPLPQLNDRHDRYFLPEEEARSKTDREKNVLKVSRVLRVYLEGLRSIQDSNEPHIVTLRSMCSARVRWVEIYPLQAGDLADHALGELLPFCEDSRADPSFQFKKDYLERALN